MLDSFESGPPRFFLPFSASPPARPINAAPPAIAGPLAFPATLPMPERPFCDDAPRVALRLADELLLRVLLELRPRALDEREPDGLFVRDAVPRALAEREFDERLEELPPEELFARVPFEPERLLDPREFLELRVLGVFVLRVLAVFVWAIPLSLLVGARTAVRSGAGRAL